MTAPELVQERVVFEQTIEGLVRALGDKLDDRCLARLKEAGLDLKAKRRVAYPVQTWVAALWIAAEVIAPDKEKDEGTYLVGRRFVEAYSETLMGKAATAMAKVVGPKRTLERMTRNLRTGSSYGTAVMNTIGPQHCEVLCAPVSVPGFYRGVLERALEMAGAKQATVVLDRWDRPEAAVFKASWS